MENAMSQSPLVGVALTANHATASVRWPDGSFESLGRVEGTYEYIEMMQRLSMSSSEYMSSPYSNMEGLWDGILRRVWRGVRTTFGLAASADLAVLARMLRATAKMAENKVGYPTSVILSFPALPALRQEDVASAIEYAGLRTPTFCGKQLDELVAAYAGHGMGLSDSEPELASHGKTHERPGRHVVLVEYTEVAVLLYCAVVERISDIPIVARGIRTNFQLGSNSGASVEEVGDFILEYLHDISSTHTHWGLPEEISVMMTGSVESVGRAGIRQAIVGAVEAFGSRANVLCYDPEYVAARGAAEMAWQAIPQMESFEV